MDHKRRNMVSQIIFAVVICLIISPLNANDLDPSHKISLSDVTLDGEVTPDDQSKLNSIKMSPMAAKTFLRYRRGWFKKVTGEERNEEHESRVRHERGRESNERTREAQARIQRLNRVCPASCWGSWSSTWSACSAPCGNSGVQQQTRGHSVSSECQAWVRQHGCPGASVRYQNCNRFCHNGGTPGATSCSCGAGWKGTCCETRVQCGSPGRPQNGEAVPFSGSLPYNTVVTYSCHTGYTLQGSTSRTCQNNQQWTNSLPTCSLVNCGDPGTGPNLVRNGNVFTFGSQVVYSCSTGHRLQGESVARCEADGTWSSTKPTCQVVSCGNAGALQNGAVTTPDGTTYGKTARFTCNVGFRLRGSATRTCQPNGQWGGNVPTCQIVLCPILAAPAHGGISHTSLEGSNGIRHGGTASFTCDTGYTLVGTNTRTCSMGTWSGQNPTCQIKNCGDPGAPAHGTRTGSFTYNSQVTFRCTAGFYMTGSESITCNSLGQWSADKATCTACARNTYKAGTNSVRSCTACPAHSATPSTGHSHISQCACNQGYRRLPNDVCQLITCAALAASSHATKQPCGSTYNEECRFSCVDGYIQSQGDSTRTCQTTGQWSGHPIVCTACPQNNYKSGVSVCSTCPANSHTNGTGSSLSGCLCDAGFQGNPGGPCSDVDECNVTISGQQNGGCEQTCINSVGSYRCKCTLAGYVKDQDDPHRCIAKNKCPAFPTPANGGAVCLAQRSTSTEKCEVKCNPGYEHMEKPNAFEECGPSTNWRWSFELNNAQITECMVAFFADVVVEAEVFYFVESCAELSDSQMEAVKQEFLEYLTAKGVCQDNSVRMACSIEDLRVDCGPEDSFFRRKRSTSRDELRFRFEVKVDKASESEFNCSTPCPEESTEDCNTGCKANYMTEAATAIEHAQELMTEAFGTSVRTRPADNDTIYTSGGEGIEGALVISGVTLIPKGPVSVSSIETKCDSGMEKRNTTCLACQKGAYLPAGGTSCVLCPNGTFQNKTKQSTCLPCPSARSRGMSSCPVCQKGTYFPAGGSRCMPCPIGSYQNRTNQTACLPCPSARSRGMSSCPECHKGTYFPAGGSRCMPCPIGSFQNRTNQTACLPCPIARSRGMSFCPECQKGTYFPAGGSRCMPCPIGSYQNRTNQTACLPCPSARSRGLSSCPECQKGTYFPAGGSHCMPCPIGSFQNRTNQTACLPCSTARSRGMTSCPARGRSPLDILIELTQQVVDRLNNGN